MKFNYTEKLESTETPLLRCSEADRLIQLYRKTREYRNTGALRYILRLKILFNYTEKLESTETGALLFASSSV